MNFESEFNKLKQSMDNNDETEDLNDMVRYAGYKSGTNNVRSYQKIKTSNIHKISNNYSS